MKLKYSFFLLAASLLAFASCKDQKSRNEQVHEFQAELTAADSTEMLRLCEDCMKLMKDGRVEEAVNSMYEYDEESESVSPLSEETKQKYIRKFDMFPVLEYEMEYYSFQLTGCNDVKYRIMFAEGDEAAGVPAAYIGFMFNPVKVDGRWYLSVKRGDQEIDQTRQ